MLAKVTTGRIVAFCKRTSVSWTTKERVLHELTITLAAAVLQEKLWTSSGGAARLGVVKTTEEMANRTYHRYLSFSLSVDRSSRAGHWLRFLRPAGGLRTT